MTIYTVPEVPGSKRTSHRPYTHAVIGRRNLALDRLVAHDPAVAAQDAVNYRYHRSIVDMGIGEIWDERRGYRVDREMLERSRSALSGIETVNQWVAKHLAIRIASINRAGTGPAGDLEVLSWSMSAANAEKAATGWRRRHVDVRVVPCVAR